MLQVCVDYLELVGGQGDIQLPHQISAPAVPNYSVNEKDALEWYYEIKGYSCCAFLDYLARYWVAYSQDVRVDVDDYFDYFCKPKQRIFHLWIQQHSSFVDAHQSELPKKKRPQLATAASRLSKFLTISPWTRRLMSYGTKKIWMDPIIGSRMSKVHRVQVRRTNMSLGGQSVGIAVLLECQRPLIEFVPSGINIEKRRSCW
jgi:hypothetical protein